MESEQPTKNTRAEQSRINGAKSRGPITAAGKARACRNAIVHGLTARQTLIGNEDAAALDRVRVRQAYLARFQPADDVEVQFTEQMIAASWRTFRALGIEAVIFNLHTDRLAAEIEEHLPYAFPDCPTPFLA